MVPAAELRLFQPLAALPRDERETWERWILERPSARPRYRDVPTLGGLGILADGRDRGQVLVEGGTTYVSADRTELQVLAALIALRAVPPFETGFVAAAQARRARRALGRLRRRHPARMAHVMTSAWGIPARWFALFDDDDRRFTASPLSLTYTTTARRSLDRLERAIPILRGADLAPAAEPLVDLYRWIAGVHPRALVRLDYGGLCDVLRWDELDDDRSARDLWASIDALAVGEGQRSAELYASVSGRFQDLRGRESLN